MCILDHTQSTFFCLGKFPKNLADDQCYSITKSSIYYYTKRMFMHHFSMEKEKEEIIRNWTFSTSANLKNKIHLSSYHLRLVLLECFNSSRKVYLTTYTNFDIKTDFPIVGCPRKNNLWMKWTNQHLLVFAFRPSSASSELVWSHHERKKTKNQILIKML